MRLLSCQLPMSEQRHGKCSWNIPNDVTQLQWRIVIRYNVGVNWDAISEMGSRMGIRAQKRIIPVWVMST
jgi:hypothetical protein